MNKKTLALVLAIALAIGAFAGLSFNLFSASAETYVPVGDELATTASTGWLSYWVKAENTEAQKGIFFTSFDNTGTEKHYAQFDPMPYVAGTNLPVAGATKYFAVPKKTITTNVSNPTLRERIVFMAKTTGATNANAADSTLGAGMEDGINKDKTYIISVWVKLPEATTETVKAYFSTARWTANIAGSTLSKSQEWTLTTQWQQISWAFNPDTTDTTNDNNNEMFFGLALTQASAVDFVGLSIKEAVIATPEPTTAPTTVPTATAVATPEPTPELVPVGDEFANISSTAWMKYWVKSANSTATDGVYFTTFDNDGSEKHYAQFATVPYVDGTNLPVAGATKYFAIPQKAVTDTVQWASLRNRLVFYAKTSNGTDAGLDDTANKDKTYVASVWVKLPQATTETIKAYFATSQYAVNIVGSPIAKSEEITLTTQWQQLSWTFNPDTAQNEAVFGLALSQASAIDFVGLSIREAGIATPAPTATPEPTPALVGDGNELVFDGNGGSEAGTKAYVKVGTATKSMWDGGRSNFAPSVAMTDADGNGLAFEIAARTSGNRVYLEPTIEEAGKYIFTTWVYFEGTGTYEIELGFVAGYPSADANRKKVTVNGGEWTKVEIISAEFAAGAALKPGIWTAAGSAAAVKFYIDGVSIQKAVLATSTPEVTPTPTPENQGGSNAGSSNTGDLVPVALIAIAVISAGALVVVARRKRED